MSFVAVCALLVVTIVVALAASSNRSTHEHQSSCLPVGTRSATALRCLPPAKPGRPSPASESRKLLLPVAAADATIIAYQPVSDTRAVALTPVGQRVERQRFVRFFRDMFSGEPSVRYYQLSGRRQRAHHLGPRRERSRTPRSLLPSPEW